MGRKKPCFSSAIAADGEKRKNRRPIILLRRDRITPGCRKISSQSHGRQDQVGNHVKHKGTEIVTTASTDQLEFVNNGQDDGCYTGVPSLPCEWSTKHSGLLKIDNMLNSFPNVVVKPTNAAQVVGKMGFNGAFVDPSVGSVFHHEKNVRKSETSSTEECCQPVHNGQSFIGLPRAGKQLACQDSLEGSDFPKYPPKRGWNIYHVNGHKSSTKGNAEIVGQQIKELKDNRSKVYNSFREAQTATDILECETKVDDSLTNITWLGRMGVANFMPARQSKEQRQMVHMSSDDGTRRPPYSYMALIQFAINSSPNRRMTLRQIYLWIENKFPFFRNAKSGWKNSVRHNLSLHDIFVREVSSASKTSYWTLRPDLNMRPLTLESIVQSIGPRQKPLFSHQSACSSPYILLPLPPVNVSDMGSEMYQSQPMKRPRKEPLKTLNDSLNGSQMFCKDDRFGSTFLVPLDAKTRPQMMHDQQRRSYYRKMENCHFDYSPKLRHSGSFSETMIDFKPPFDNFFSRNYENVTDSAIETSKWSEPSSIFFEVTTNDGQRQPNIGTYSDDHRKKNLTATEQQTSTPLCNGKVKKSPHFSSPILGEVSSLDKGGGENEGRSPGKSCKSCKNFTHNVVGVVSHDAPQKRRSSMPDNNELHSYDSGVGPRSKSDFSQYEIQTTGYNTDCSPGKSFLPSVFHGEAPDTLSLSNSFSKLLDLSGISFLGGSGCSASQLTDIADISWSDIDAI